MGRTNEQTDNLNKVLVAQGKAPLPYQDVDDNDSSTTQEEKDQVAKEEQDKIDAEAKLKESATMPDQSTSEEKKETNEPALTITDEAVLKFLKEKGIEVSSIDSLKHTPSAEDIQKQKEERDSAIISYGLQNGLCTSKDYEQYVADINAKQDLVYQNYKSEALEEDSDLTDAEIEEEFKSKFGLDSDNTSRKFKRGQKELAILADKIIRSRHDKVLTLESKYSSHEANQISIKESEAKIAKALPQYNADVKAAIAEVSKISSKFSDSETYDVPVSADAIKKLEGILLNENYAKNQVLKGYTKEELRQLVESHIKLTNFDDIVMSVASQYSLKKQAGTKGIPENTGTERKGTDGRVLTEAQKQVLAMNGYELAPIAN